eukprot:gene7797-10592_t
MNHLLDNLNVNIHASNFDNHDEFDRIGRTTSITKIYEPKFLKIFEQYIQNVGVDDSMHLLSLSLQHLCSFCRWARESNDRNTWINKMLNNNIDLRSEVRNGLAKILIYCLSSFKSSKLKDTDFFMVLQDSVHGLGIVNKTSLKIYNDPYKYFDFIKTCLSGLIDAGLVPENERQNQPKKPKHVEENIEEFAAFNQMKDILTAMIKNDKKSTAKFKIEQILDIWQHGHKNIRAKRFVVAVSILNDREPWSSHSFSFAHRPKVLLPGQNSSNLPFEESVYLNKQSHQILKTSSTVSTDEESSNDGNCRGLLSLANVSSKVLAAETLAKDYDKLHDDWNKKRAAKDVIEGFEVDEVRKLGKLYHEFHSSQHNELTDVVCNDKGYVSPVVLQCQPVLSDKESTSFVTTNIYSVDLFTNSRNQCMSAPPSTCHKFLPFMKMLQTSDKSWEMNEMRVFDLPSQLSHTESSIFLIDESKLTASELSTGILTVEATKHHHDACVVLKRNSSLQSELQSRKAIVAMWTTHEYPQLVSLLQNWQINCSSSTSLQSYWKQSSYLSNPLSSNEVYDDNRYTSIPSGHAGHGILVYEEVQRFGIVIRQNSRLNITEDYWRILYPNDLHHTTSTFQNFLQFIFPQLKLNAISPSATSESSSPLSPMKIVVKYFPHNEAHPFTRPPAMEDLKSYQTLGTLDEDAYDMIGRFDATFSFHDIMLDLI